MSERENYEGIGSTDTVKDLSSKGVNAGKKIEKGIRNAKGVQKTAKAAGTAKKASALKALMATPHGIIIVAVAVAVIFVLLVLLLKFSPNSYTSTEDSIDKTVDKITDKLSSSYRQVQNDTVIQNETLEKYINDKFTGIDSEDAFISDATHITNKNSETGDDEIFDCGWDKGLHFNPRAAFDINKENDEATIETTYCTVTFKFTPGLKDIAKLMLAYAQSVNGYLGDKTEKAREEGEPSENLEDDVLTEKQKENAEVDVEYDKVFSYPDEESEEYIVDTTYEHGDTYDALGSENAINDIVNYVKNQKLFGVANPERWKTDEWNIEPVEKTIERPYCQVVEYKTVVDSSTGRGTVQKQFTGDQFLCDSDEAKSKTSFEENGNVDYYTFTYYRENVTFLVPIAYDISGYKRDELDNVALAYSKSKQHINVEDMYKEGDSIISDYYTSYIDMFGLREIQDKLIDAVFNNTELGDYYQELIASGQNPFTRAGFFGFNEAVVTGDCDFGEIGEVEPGAFPYENYVFPGGGLYGYGIYTYSDQIWKHVSDLRASGSLHLSSSDLRQCTNFVNAWIYDHYDGLDGVSAAGYAMAQKYWETYPSVFERGDGPKAGGIISMYPNHVAVCEKIYEKNGETYYILSDGNIGDSHGVRIQWEISAKDFYNGGPWGGWYGYTFANPK